MDSTSRRKQIEQFLTLKSPTTAVQSATTTRVEDLGLDSLDVVELQTIIERDGPTIPTALLSELHSLDDLLALADSRDKEEHDNDA